MVVVGRDDITQAVVEDSKRKSQLMFLLCSGILVHGKDISDVELNRIPILGFLVEAKKLVDWGKGFYKKGDEVKARKRFIEANVALNFIETRIIPDLSIDFTRLSSTILKNPFGILNIKDTFNKYILGKEKQVTDYEISLDTVYQDTMRVFRVIANGIYERRQLAAVQSILDRQKEDIKARTEAEEFNVGSRDGGAAVFMAIAPAVFLSYFLPHPVALSSFFHSVAGGGQAFLSVVGGINSLIAIPFIVPVPIFMARKMEMRKETELKIGVNIRKKIEKKLKEIAPEQIKKLKDKELEDKFKDLKELNNLIQRLDNPEVQDALREFGLDKNKIEALKYLLQKLPELSNNYIERETGVRNRWRLPVYLYIYLEVVKGEMTDEEEKIIRKAMGRGINFQREFIFYERIRKAIKEGYFNKIFGEEVIIKEIREVGDKHFYLQLDVKAQRIITPEFQGGLFNVKMGYFVNTEIGVEKKYEFYKFYIPEERLDDAEYVLGKYDEIGRKIIRLLIRESNIVTDSTKIITLVGKSGEEHKIIYKPYEPIKTEREVLRIYEFLGYPGYKIYLDQDKYGDFGWIEYIPSVCVEKIKSKMQAEQLGKLTAITYVLGNFDIIPDNILIRQNEEKDLIQIDHESVFDNAYLTPQRHLNGIIKIFFSPEVSRAEVRNLLEAYFKGFISQCEIIDNKKEEIINIVKERFVEKLMKRELILDTIDYLTDQTLEKIIPYYSRLITFREQEALRERIEDLIKFQKKFPSFDTIFSTLVKVSLPPFIFSLEKGVQTIEDLVSGPYSDEDGLLKINMKVEDEKGKESILAFVLKGTSPAQLNKTEIARQFVERAFNEAVSEAVWKELDKELQDAFPQYLKILDLGTGKGALLATLPSKWRGSIVAFDYVRSFLEELKSRYPDVETKQGDWLNTGFEDGLFDVIVGLDAIDLVFNEGEMRELIDELDRIIKYGPDGKKRIWQFFDNVSPLWYGDTEGLRTAYRKLKEYPLGSRKWISQLEEINNKMWDNFSKAYEKILKEKGYETKKIKITKVVEGISSPIHQGMAPGFNVFNFGPKWGALVPNVDETFRRDNPGYVCEQVDIYGVLAWKSQEACGNLGSKKNFTPEIKFQKIKPSIISEKIECESNLNTDGGADITLEEKLPVTRTGTEEAGSGKPESDFKKAPKTDGGEDKGGKSGEEMPDKEKVAAMPAAKNAKMPVEVVSPVEIKCRYELARSPDRNILLTFMRDENGKIQPVFSDSGEFQSIREIDVPAVLGEWNPLRNIQMIPLELQETTFNKPMIDKTENWAILPEDIRSVFEKGNVLVTSKKEKTPYSVLMVTTPQDIPGRRGRSGVPLRDGLPIIIEIDGKEFIVEIKGVGTPEGGYLIADRRLAGGIDGEFSRREISNLKSREKTPAYIRGEIVMRVANIMIRPGQGYVIRLSPGSIRASYSKNIAFPEINSNRYSYLVSREMGRLLGEGKVGITHLENFIVERDGKNLIITDYSDIFHIADFPTELERKYFTPLKSINSALSVVEEVPGYGSNRETHFQSFLKGLLEGLEDSNRLNAEQKDELLTLKDFKEVADFLWKQFLFTEYYETLKANGAIPYHLRVKNLDRESGFLYGFLNAVKTEIRKIYNTCKKDKEFLERYLDSKELRERFEKSGTTIEKELQKDEEIITTIEEADFDSRKMIAATKKNEPLRDRLFEKFMWLSSSIHHGLKEHLGEQIELLEGGIQSTKEELKDEVAWNLKIAKAKYEKIKGMEIDEFLRNILESPNFVVSMFMLPYYSKLDTRGDYGKMKAPYKEWIRDIAKNDPSAINLGIEFTGKESEIKTANPAARTDIDAPTEETAAQPEDAGGRSVTDHLSPERERNREEPQGSRAKRGVMKASRGTTTFMTGDGGGSGREVEAGLPAITIEEFKNLKGEEPRICISFDELRDVLALPEFRGVVGIEQLEFCMDLIKEPENEILEKAGIEVRIDRIDFVVNPEDCNLFGYVFADYVKKDHKIVIRGEKIEDVLMGPRTATINLSVLSNIRSALSDIKPKLLVSFGARYMLVSKIVEYPITRKCKTLDEFNNALLKSLKGGSHEYIEGWKSNLSDYLKYLPEDYLENKGNFYSVLHNILGFNSKILCDNIEKAFWPDRAETLDEIRRVDDTLLYDPEKTEDDILNLATPLSLGEITRQEFEETAIKKLPEIAFWEARGKIKGNRDLEEISRNTAEDIAANLDTELLKFYNELVEYYVKAHKEFGLKKISPEMKKGVGVMKVYPYLVDKINNLIGSKVTSERDLKKQSDSVVDLLLEIMGEPDSYPGYEPDWRYTGREVFQRLLGMWLDEFREGELNDIKQLIGPLEECKRLFDDVGRDNVAKAVYKEPFFIKDVERLFPVFSGALESIPKESRLIEILKRILYDFGLELPEFSETQRQLKSFRELLDNREYKAL